MGSKQLKEIQAGTGSRSVFLFRLKLKIKNHGMGRKVIQGIFPPELLAAWNLP